MVFYLTQMLNSDFTSQWSAVNTNPSAVGNYVISPNLSESDHLFTANQVLEEDLGGKNKSQIKSQYWGKTSQVDYSIF